MFSDLVRIDHTFENRARLLDDLQVLYVGSSFTNLLDDVFTEILELVDECGVSGDQNLGYVLHCWVFQLMQ